MDITDDQYHAMIVEIAALKAELRDVNEVLENYRKDWAILTGALEEIIELGPSAIKAHQAYTIARKALGAK
jgi:hypothetical protein